ncbi:arylalcohol dehydrogenase [Mycena capillaripes]|nr:arylalcohol dehydrogenase [Mycena capillaripes]
MGFFNAAPPPPTALGRYRALSKHASVHVSPLVLGAMSIGDAWSAIGFGSMDKTSSFTLLDAFYEAGGNFIDTANNYQNESSEMFIGEWMESRSIRDQMVIATKVFLSHSLAPDIKYKINYHGNNSKSMHLSLEASLKKLRTSYIDLFYVHVWDFETSIKEVMDNLHSLVLSGKVLYLGISDTPAWIVSQCNQYAIDHGKTPFAVYQGSWNVMDRTFEREILPWLLRSDAEEERREKSGEMGRDIKIDDNGWKRTPREEVSNALEKVAKEVGVDSVTAVAIAYLLHKAPYVFPIVALTISLSPAQIQYLESINTFDVGFPHTIVVSLSLSFTR